MENDVRPRRDPRKSFGPVSHGDVSLRQRLQHGQLRRSRIGQHQKIDSRQGETCILRPEPNHRTPACNNLDRFASCSMRRESALYYRLIEVNPQTLLSIR